MGDETRKAYQDTMQKEVEELNRLYIRPIEKELHLCSARCCENTTITRTEVNNCLRKCSIPLNNAQDFVSTEFGNFQSRLTRCIEDCNDIAKDKLGLKPTESEIERESRAFEKCASICVDKHLELLPNFRRKIHEVLKNKVKEE